MTRSKEALKPIKGNRVKIFVCGPTVYDYSHIGHARTYIAFDVIVRYLKHQGYSVFYLQNITDVDDKIINRAVEAGQDPLDLAREFEAKYLEDMETLTTLAFAPLKTDQNHIAVYAGDKQNGMTLAFSGDIVSAVPNFNAAPDPTFDCDCITGFVASLTPVPPLTAQGAQDVGNTLQSIAGQMGLTFVNRGVNVSLRNTCWVGGPMEQARQIADAARIALLVDDGEMIIAPPGMLREDVGASTPLWRGDTGMFGYPSFDSNGISVKGLYEPKCKLGGPIRIESVVPKASGLWQISSLSHKLQAGYPGATSWETVVKATYPGQQNQKDGKS